MNFTQRKKQELVLYAHIIRSAYLIRLDVLIQNRVRVPAAVAHRVRYLSPRSRAPDNATKKNSFQISGLRPTTHTRRESPRQRSPRRLPRGAADPTRHLPVFVVVICGKV
ncbi:hypothetical protein VPH35_110421 [Triticum aestivum]